MWYSGWHLYCFTKINQCKLSLQSRKCTFLKKDLWFLFLAIILLSLKAMLQGVVVLFPFSGIFTVVEMRDDLEVLASEFTKNSVSILSFLLIVYATQLQLSDFIRQLLADGSDV